MIAIDTNIVVRFLSRDDADQYQKAYALFAEHDVFIADTVILETEWVLRFAYHYDTPQISDAFTKLMGLTRVHVSHPSIMAQTIAWYRQGLDFADAFHLANSQHCKVFFTFDKKMINAANKITTCEVISP